MISIAGLEESRKPNPAKVWSEFKEEFLQNSFKIIKRDVERYQVDDHQILKIIKEHHRHQREKYQKQQVPEKDKQNRAKNRENQRMTAVKKILISKFCIYKYRNDFKSIFQKINQRKKGFTHLKKTNSGRLKSLLPIDIPESQALNDLKKIIGKSGYHSDEISETDAELAEEEKKRGVWQDLEPDRYNHVIKIVRKEWRSKKVTITIDNLYKFKYQYLYTYILVS